MKIFFLLCFIKKICNENKFISINRMNERTNESLQNDEKKKTKHEIENTNTKKFENDKNDWNRKKFCEKKIIHIVFEKRFYHVNCQIKKTSNVQKKTMIEKNWRFEFEKTHASISSRSIVFKYNFEFNRQVNIFHEHLSRIVDCLNKYEIAKNKLSKIEDEKRVEKFDKEIKKNIIIVYFDDEKTNDEKISNDEDFIMKNNEDEKISEKTKIWKIDE